MLSTDCNSHFCPILSQLRESSGVDGGRNSNAGSDQAQLFPTRAFSQDRALARALDLFVSHPPSLFPPPCVLRKTMGNVNPGQRALQVEHWTLPQWREGGLASGGHCGGIHTWYGVVSGSATQKRGMRGGGSIISFVLILPIC